MKLMQKVWKRVKKLTPHCADCGEELQGNGSVITPYKCKCGEWQYSFVKHEYYLKGSETIEDTHLDPL